MSKNFYELYNLAEDPGEKRNLYRKNKEKAAEMKAEIIGFVEGVLRKP